MHDLTTITMEVESFLTDRSGSKDEGTEGRVECLLQSHVMLDRLVRGLHLAVGVVVGIETVHRHLLLVLLGLGFAEGFRGVYIDGRDTDEGLHHGF